MKAIITQFIRQFVVLSAALAAALLFVMISYASTWTGPPTSPPNNNTPAPLNIGASSQTKIGAITSNTTVTSPQFCIGASCITTWASAGVQPCPSGFTQVNGVFCIETNEHPATDWWTAVGACAVANANLCGRAQWYYACTQAGTLGINTMIDNYEWIDDGDDIGTSWTYTGRERTVGSGSCTQTNYNSATVSAAYRCCFER